MAAAAAWPAVSAGASARSADNAATEDHTAAIHGRTAHNHLLKEYTACLHRREPPLHRPRRYRISPPSTPIEICTWLGRPIFTPCRLSIAPACSGGHHLVPDKIAAQRPARDARRGILDNADVRREHPAVDGGLVGAALRREEEDAVRGRRRRCHQLVVCRRIDRRAVDGAPRRHGNEQKRHAARHDLHRQAGPGDGGGRRARARRRPARDPASDRETSAGAASSRRRSGRLPPRERHRHRAAAEAEDEPLASPAQSRPRAPARTCCRSSDAPQSASRRPA